MSAADYEEAIDGPGHAIGTASRPGNSTCDGVVARLPTMVSTPAPAQGGDDRDENDDGGSHHGSPDDYR